MTGDAVARPAADGDMVLTSDPPIRADVRGEEPASYRDAQRMLEFRGSPTAPLLIVRLGDREAVG